MRRLAFAATLTALVAGGCGDEEPPRDPLAWAGAPVVQRSPSLPDDRVMSARIRNTSDEPIELRADDVEVRDGAGRPLRSSAAFLSGFVYSHVPYNRGRDEVPSALPRPEQERLGRVVRVDAGGEAPLTVSWSGRGATRVDYGRGTLPVPRRVSP